MCEQCSAKTISYGEVVPDWALVQATRDGNTMRAGDWGLVDTNDPEFVWSTTPIKDPCYDMTDEEIDACPEETWNKWRVFSDCVADIEKSFTVLPSFGYDLVTASAKVGYDIKERGFMHWLVHRMACVIETYVPVE